MMLNALKIFQIKIYQTNFMHEIRNEKASAILEENSTCLITKTHRIIGSKTLSFQLCRATLGNKSIFVVQFPQKVHVFRIDLIAIFKKQSYVFCIYFLYFLCY